MEILTPALEPTVPQVYHYQGLLARFFALLLDGLILSPIGLLGYFNSNNWHISIITFMVNIIPLIYRIYFETNKGATPGKMVLNMKIVNLQYQKSDFKTILKRNAFNILGLIASFTTMYTVVSTEPQAGGNFSITWGHSASFGIGLLFIVDAIVLLTDKRKQSMHDKLGGTYVIKDTERAAIDKAW